MSQVFTDTSAWYALLSANDAHHGKAKRFLEALSGTLLTSNYVVAETANLLRYRLGMPVALEFLTMLRQTALVEVLMVTAEQHDRTIDLFEEQGSKGLSFTDCSSLVLMREQGLPKAFCFDTDFERAGVACVP